MTSDDPSRAAFTAKAKELALNLDDQANSFTVWSDDPNGPIFCGAKETLNAAFVLAREHVGVKNLVIMSANPRHGLRRVTDDDRVNIPPLSASSGSR